MSIEFLDHTADLGLRATGRTPEETFCEVARGLFMLMIDPATVKLRQKHSVHIEAANHADLLVEWLSDLLAQKELTGLVFAEFEARIASHPGGLSLDGVATGERLDPAVHHPRIEVKGISYLGLNVRRGAGGWTAQCVVDV